MNDFLAMFKKTAKNMLPDPIFLKLRYHRAMGKKLDLKKPETFNEKLQWLKLHDRKSEYTTMVDKYAVKKYIADLIGEEYIIPTLGVWERFEDIDFDSLPNQFVLKCTHDSGGLVIVRDKAKLDKVAAKRKIEASLKRNYFYSGREWPYKNVKPRILAEKYMEDKTTSELRDYKFFCFDGEPKILFIASERQKVGEEVKFDFFDVEGNHLAVKNGHPNAEEVPALPQNFELMKQLAKQVSAGIPHLRVDFYEMDGNVYFGELTFYHFSGMVPFDPPEWDEKLGSWLKLPQK